MFLTFGQQISSHLLTQDLELIELLVVEFSPTAHAGFCNLEQSGIVPLLHSAKSGHGFPRAK